MLGRLAQLDGPPYNLVLHTAPLGGQVEATYHWHWEIHPRLREIAGLEVVYGLPVNPVSPEEAVDQFLRRLAPGADDERDAWTGPGDQRPGVRRGPPSRSPASHRRRFPRLRSGARGRPARFVFGSEDRWSSLSRAAGGWGR